MGNETGYLVAMSLDSRPEPLRLAPGTVVTLESNYTAEDHFGVMALCARCSACSASRLLRGGQSRCLGIAMVAQLCGLSKHCGLRHFCSSAAAQLQVIMWHQLATDACSTLGAGQDVRGLRRLRHQLPWCCHVQIR